MRSFYFILGILYFIHVLNIQGQSEENDEDNADELDPSLSYCFRFTWLGPNYDNNTQGMYNTTCSEWREESRAEGVPCRTPFVITFDGTPPDMQYIWDHYKTEVVCRRARGQVCAKYSYSFNDALLNVTYMCTRAFVVDEGAVTRGCYDQKIDSTKVEVCLCESGPGPYMPCNK